MHGPCGSTKIWRADLWPRGERMVVKKFSTARAPAASILVPAQSPSSRARDRAGRQGWRAPGAGLAMGDMCSAPAHGAIYAAAESTSSTASTRQHVSNGQRRAAGVLSRRGISLRSAFENQVVNSSPRRFAKSPTQVGDRSGFVDADSAGHTSRDGGARPRGNGRPLPAVILARTAFTLQPIAPGPIRRLRAPREHGVRTSVVF